MSKINSLLLCGCGNMGNALLAGWRSRGTAPTVYVVDPVQKDACARLGDVPETFVPDAVVFAVKPQHLEALLPEYAARFGTHPLYISIAAGKTLAAIAAPLGEHARVIRAMPNTPALVRAGVTALVAGAYATEGDRAATEALFSTAGQILWLEDEEQMHAVTALSGSGPAYTFLFLESLARAGVKAGLAPEVARDLALHTVLGSCELAARTGEGLSQLRAKVTSPGGTTEAALKALVLLPQLIINAVDQAIKRSRELAGK